MKYKKQTITQVRASFKKGVPFNGFLVGNKVNSFHWFGGWRLAHEVKCDTLETFEEHKNACEFYLEPELGSRIAIYVYA